MRYGKGFLGWLFGRLSKGRRRKQDKVAKRRERRLSLEGLEQRQLLSAAGLTVMPLPPIIVSQGTPAQVVPLTGVFHDANSSASAMRYSVVADSDPSLFSAVPLADPTGRLLLRFAGGVLGTVDLTIQATSFDGQSAESTVSVDVVAAGSAGVSPAQGSAKAISQEFPWVGAGSQSLESIGPVDSAAVSGGAAGSRKDALPAPSFPLPASPTAPGVPPLIGVGFPRIDVSENSAASVVDLSKGFIDPSDPSSQLTFSITADSNPGLFAATGTDGSNGQLSLAYSAGASGTAHLVITATDLAGDSASTTLMVMVTQTADTTAAVRTAASGARSAATTPLFHPEDDSETTTLYWDPDQLGAASETVTAGDPWNGTWDPTTACWYDPSADGGADVAWIDGSNAVFAGTPGGTVVIVGNPSPSSVVFEEGGYTIANSTSSDGLSVPSGSTTTFDVEADGATISANVSVAGSLVVTGPGTLTNSGTIALQSSGYLTNNGTLTNSGTIDVQSGGMLYNAMSDGETSGMLTNPGIGRRHDRPSPTSAPPSAVVGTLTNSGTIDVQSGGMLYNAGRLNVQSGGFLNNAGALNNSGTINLQSGGELYNSMFPTSSGGVMYGTLTNSATIIVQSNGWLWNSGTLNNSGTINVQSDGWAVNSSGAMNHSGTLTNSGTIDVQSGGTLVNAGTLNNNATINLFRQSSTCGWLFNTGTLNNSGTIDVQRGGALCNTGTLANSGTIDVRSGGTLSNNGSVTNSGTIGLECGNSDGFLCNSFFGTLTNSGTIFVKSSGFIFNYGTLTNTGSIYLGTGGGPSFDGYQAGVLYNESFGPEGALTNITNSGTIDGLLSNNGSVTNSGTISWLDNSGTLTNSGTISGLDNSGIVTNSGTVSGLDNSGTLTNSGTINVQSYGTMYNAGTLSNTSTGSLDNSGNLENLGALNNSGTLTNSGTVTNSGTIDVQSSGRVFNCGTLTNSGTVTNSGIIDVETGGLLSNSGTLNNNGTINLQTGGELYSDRCARWSPGGTVTNSDDGSINVQGGGLLSNETSSTITNYGAFSVALSGAVQNAGTLDLETPLDGVAFNLPGGQITGPYANDMDSNESDVLQAVVGQPLSFSSTILDPNLQAGDTASIDWGDSSPPTPNVPLAVSSVDSDGSLAGVAVADHTYSAAGFFTIEVTTSDDVTKYYEVDVAASPVAVNGLTTVTNDGVIDLQVSYDITTDAFELPGAYFTVNIDVAPASDPADGTYVWSFPISGASNLTIGSHSYDVQPEFTAALSDEACLTAQVGSGSANAANFAVCENGAFVDAAGCLNIFGTPAADTISILQSGRSSSGTITVNLNSQTFKFPVPSISSIFVQSYSGNDELWTGCGVTAPVTVYGSGDDSILNYGASNLNGLHGGPGSWYSNGTSTNNYLYNTNGTTTVSLLTDSNNDGTIDAAGATDSAVAMGPGCNVYAGGNLQEVDVSVADNGQYNGDPLQLTFNGDGTTIEVFDSSDNRIYSGQTIGTDNNGFPTTAFYVQALTGGSSVLTVSLIDATLPTLYDRVRINAVANMTPSVDQNNQTDGDGSCVGGSSPGSDLTGTLEVEGPSDFPFVLKYDSQNVNDVVVAFDYTLSPFQALPSYITAQVTVGSYSPDPVYYSTGGLAPGSTVELMQQLDLGGQGFQPGRYAVTMVVSDPDQGGSTLATLTGYVDYAGTAPTSELDFDGDSGGSVNLCGCCNHPPQNLDVHSGRGGEPIYSAVGSLPAAGFLPDDGSTGDGVVLPNVGTFVYDDSTGQFDSPAGTNAKLQWTNSNYQLSFPDGSAEDFNSDGQMSEYVDPQGNVTTYGDDGTPVTDSNNPDQEDYDITTPQGSSMDFTIASVSGVELVQSLTESPSGQSFTFCYGQTVNGDPKLTTITEYGSGSATEEQWTYYYDTTTGLLEWSNGPGGATTQYFYDSKGRFTGETQWSGAANTSTELGSMSLMSEESLLLNNASDGTSEGTAIQLILASQVHSTRTDFTATDLAGAQSGGEKSTYTTDNFGNVLSETNPLGQTTTYIRNVNGVVTQETVPSPDGQPLVTSYAYDAYGNLTQEVYPNGTSEEWTYDTGSQWTSAITSYTDQLGNVTSYTIDPATGLTTSTTEAYGTPLAATTYDIYTGPTATDQVIAANGATIGGVTLTGDTTYEAIGFSTTAVAYESLPTGTLLAEIDPLGNATVYQYGTSIVGVLNNLVDQQDEGSFDQQTAVTTAYGTPQAATTCYTYDSNGNQTSMTDPAGNVTDYTYDAFGNMITSSTGPYADPAGAKMLAPGDADVALNPLSNDESPYTGWLTVPTGYSGLNCAFTDVANATASYTFKNLVVNQRYEIDANWTAWGENTADAEYSLANGMDGDIVSVDQMPPTRADTTFDFAPFQQLFVFTAQASQVTVFLQKANEEPYTFIWAGPMIIQEARTNVTTYEYDAYGNQTAVIDPLGNETRTVYDPTGQSVLEQIGPNGVTNYYYDADGNRAAELDPGSQFTINSYDSMQRPSGTSTGEAVETGAATSWTLGNLAQSSEQRSFELYVFTSATLASGWQSTYSVTGSDSFAPGTSSVPVASEDASGNFGGWYDLGTVTFNAGDTASSVIVSDTSSAPALVGIVSMSSQTAYDAAGNVASTTDALGNTTTYEYDAVGNQVVEIDPAPGNGEAQPVSRSVYDAAGNLVQSVDALGNSTEYHYDALGNQDLQTDPQPEPGAALPQEQTTYDLDGDITSQTDALGNTTSYTYDHQNRQTQVTKPAAEAGGTKPVTQTIYDANGDVTATIDPLGRVTASTYDTVGDDIADYSGEVLSTPTTGSTWTFTNLTLDCVTYDVYVNAGAAATGYEFTGATLCSTPDPNAPSLGAGWQFLKTVTLNPSATATLSHPGSNAPTSVCVLQQTSATAYDADGNVTATTDALQNTTQYAYDSRGERTTVTAPDPADGMDDNVTQTVYDIAGDVTATIDPLGRVAASFYDAAGNDMADYQGQIVPSGTGPWTFNNLSPNNELTYDVYVYSTAGTLDRNTADYSFTGTGGTASLSGNDPTAPSLGNGWSFLETIQVSSSALSALSVSCSPRLGTIAPGAVCLLQQTTATAYDANGNVTATTDALGHVSASTYDNLGEDIADYHGQVVDTGATGYTTNTWTFNNLTPNSAQSYDVYYYSTTPLNDTWRVNGAPVTWGGDSTAPLLGGDWYLLGSTSTAASTVAVSLTDGTAPGAVALLQNTAQTAYDLDGEVTATFDALNHVAATFYNTAGEGVAAYQGEIGSTGTSFTSLSPNNQLSYDVYVYSTTALSGTWRNSYSVTVGATTVTVPSADQTAPNLGPNWYFWGALPVTTSATSLTVNGPSSTVCLLQQVSSTAYDADGDVTATTDALGRVTATSYNDAGEVAADYRGQVVQTVGATNSWTFNNLSSNRTDNYDVYYYSSTPLSGWWRVNGVTVSSWGIDSTAPSLGAGWHLLGSIASPNSTVAVTCGGTVPGAVALLQNDSQYAYDLDGEQTVTTDATGNVTATSYDAQGEAVTNSAGLIVTTGQSANIDGGSYSTSGGKAYWTFTDLVPYYTGNFEVYVEGGTQSGYTFKGSSNNTLNFTAAANPGTSPLGSGWYDLGTVSLLSGSVISVSLPTSGGLPGAVCLVWQTSAMAYDADGNLAQKTDGDGHVTTYGYDQSNLETSETWYSNPSKTILTNQLAYTYDADGELATAADWFSAYQYTYNSSGEETSVNNSGAPNSPQVALSSTYDADGDRTSLSAAIGVKNDFLNKYSYDSQNRETQVTQAAQSGGDGVDPKTATFSYNADGQTATTDRFNSTNSSSGEVALSTYSYDGLGRLKELSQKKTGGPTYADYQWTYDADNEVTTATNSSYANEDAAYCYDSTGQLVAAAPDTVADPGETANAANSLTNSYDADGSATTLNGAATQIGPDNEMLFDGTYSYQYDADGNCTAKYISSNGWDPQIDASATDITTYAYDNRNRLTQVATYASYSAYSATPSSPSQTVTYTYDMFDNLIARTVTGGTNPGTQRYVYDGTNMVLAFDGNGNLTDRYLWGPGVNQLLADENYSLPTSPNPSSTGTTLWALGDNQNTVRDLVTDNGTLAAHIAYSPFGQQVQISTSYVDPAYSGIVAAFAFGYTGEYTDTVTGDQLHGVRWYDPASERWLTQDPSGFAGGDANLYRYCRNSPTIFIDPSGLKITTGDVFVFNSLTDKEHQVKQHWEHYMFKKDATGCYLQGGLNITYTEVDRHVDVYSVTYNTNSAGAWSMWCGIICSVTAGAAGINALLPEPFLSKGAAIGCVAVSAVTGVGWAVFGYFADTHEIGRDLIKSGWLAGWKDFKVDSYYLDGGLRSTWGNWWHLDFHIDASGNADTSRISSKYPNSDKNIPSPTNFGNFAPDPSKAPGAWGTPDVGDGFETNTP